MIAKVICMASDKGGSGKTILTATFSAFLASLGKEVLMIDTDAATNGLTLLYLKEVRVQAQLAIKESRKPKGVYESITTNNPAEIIKLDNGVHMVPAIYEFSNTECIAKDNYQSSLTTTLDSLKDSYNYIFLDAQAGSDVYAQIAMSKNISDEVVIVSEYDPMSAAGVERLKGLFRDDLTYERTWILLNKLLPEFVQSFSDFLEVVKYLNPIPWDAEVVRAYVRRKTALNFDTGNEHTLAVMQTIKTLLGEEISEELKVWEDTRAEILRQQVEDQYKDIEKELQGLLYERNKIVSLAERKRIKRVLIAATIVFLILFTTMPKVSQLLRQLRELLSKSPMPPDLYDSLVPAVLFFVITFIVSVSIYIAYSLLISKKISKTIDISSEMEVGEARIRRREFILEEKLRKLEALRDANLETLLKSNK